MGIPERWRRSPPLPPDIAERLARVPEVCARHGARLCYLFGSMARADGPPPDDVDLAFLPGESTDGWALRLDLADALATDRLDLEDLSRASAVDRFEVLRTGRLLFRANVEIENDFERRTIAEYKDRAIVRRRQHAWMLEALGK